MFIESIEYQREKDSEWEKGWFVGEGEYSINGVILNEKCQPLLQNEFCCSIWDYHHDPKGGIRIRVDRT